MIFNVHVTVPSSVIKQIGCKIRALLMNELINKTKICDKDIYIIERLMEKVINECSIINGNSYEGITIDDRSDIDKIAHELSVGRRVGAIKLFRKATGLELVDAKKIIDRFEPTIQGCNKFIIAFS